MKNITARETVEGFIRDLDDRLSRQERHTHHGVGVVDPSNAMAISSDHNNFSRLGSDYGCYTREVVCKGTPPVARDFGGRLLPGYVWVETGPITSEDCVTFDDDYERADGPLGADWGPGRLRDDPGSTWGTTYHVETLTPTIVSGHVEGAEDAPEDYTVILINDVVSTISTPGDQFIEILVSNYHQGQFAPPLAVQHQIVEGGWELYCQANDTDLTLTGLHCEFFINSATSSELWGYVYQQDAAGQAVDIDQPETDPTYSVGIGWPDNSPELLRFEVSVTGHVRFLCDGVVLLEADVPPIVGDHVGYGFRWHNTYYSSTDPIGGTGTSFHVEAARGGCLEAPATLSVTPMVAGECTPWEDDFERADGPVGANWMLGPPLFPTAPEMFTIEDGAAVAPKQESVSSHEAGSMLWAEPQPDDSQVIEIEFENFPRGTGTGGTSIELVNFMDPATSIGWAAELSWGFPVQIIAFYGEFLWDEPLEGTLSGESVSAGTHTLRFETNRATSHHIVTLDGAVILEGDLPVQPWWWEDAPVVPGDYQGIYLDWGIPGVAAPEGSPRILSVNNGCEGAAGCQLWAWTGAEYVLGPVSYWDGRDWLPATAAYAWDGRVWQPSIT